MEQSGTPLNRWLISYIVQYQHTHSRYDIDRTLLLSGYSPAELEAAWQLVLSGEHQKLTLTPDEIKYQKRAPLIGCFKYGCFTCLVILTILIVLIYLYFNPALPEPLPDYPGATKLTLKVSLPRTFLFPSCYLGEDFQGEKYQLLTSTNSPEQIQSFYKNAALARGLGYVGTDTNFARNQNTFGSTCFSEGKVDFNLSRRIPTLAVRIFNRSEYNDAKIIAQYFPQVPLNTNVILLLQGFKYLIKY